MNLQSMDYILATARERSISRAAELLHITQQTLSAHISAVEKELGCPLFVRRVPLEITYAGEEFLKYAGAIQKQVRDLRRTFADIAGEERGRLKIGVTDNRGRIVLLPIVATFQEAHPRVEIQVLEATNEELIQMLVKGEVDVCISNLVSRRPDIHSVDLYPERMVFVVRKDLFRQRYPERPEEAIRAIEEGGEHRRLQDFPLLLGSEQDISGKFARSLMAGFDREPDVRVEAESSTFLLGLCARGLGACFCPEIIVKNTLSSEQLKDMLLISLGREAEYRIRLGWRDGGAVLEAFVRTAREQVGKWAKGEEKFL